MTSPFACSSLPLTHSIDPHVAAHVLLILQVKDEEILSVRMSFIEEHPPFVVHTRSALCIEEQGYSKSVLAARSLSSAA
ncbi:unnamed protein product [Victoria cruziana]